MPTPLVRASDESSGPDIDATGRQWMHLHIMVCKDCIELFRTNRAEELARKLLLTGYCEHNYVWVLKP